MFDERATIRALVPHLDPAKPSGSGRAPANIALCKYWGKRNEALKLPMTGSLSISLADLGTETRITPADTDQLVLDGRAMDGDVPAAKRLFTFLDLFREPNIRFRVESRNTIPMAAGLASSASAFAATVRALEDLYQWDLPVRDLSILARLGSGSASRSLEHGFVEWHRGDREDGMDSFAERLAVEWPEFRVGILTLSTEKKPVGSTEGMRRTRGTSRLYASWESEVAHALPRIRNAVRSREFATVGAAAEQNALTMHATMIAAWPPILYWRPETVAVLHQVHALRADGVQVYATLDAGPNVKLLFTETETPALLEAFPGVRMVRPFG